MSKYGSGLSFGQVCNMEKEQIKEALKGRLVCGENEDGFEYAEASKEECEKFILGAYDEVVYQALQVMSSARALEGFLKDSGVKYNVPDLVEKISAEQGKYNDYVFEKED